MKSWCYLSKHLEGSGRNLISDILGPIQGKILTNQERDPLMFRFKLSDNEIQLISDMSDPIKGKILKNQVQVSKLSDT